MSENPFLLGALSVARVLMVYNTLSTCDEGDFTVTRESELSCKGNPLRILGVGASVQSCSDAWWK